jgi:ATP synthase protein I
MATDPVAAKPEKFSDSRSSFEEVGVEDDNFKPLTAEQAHAFRSANPQMNLWWIVSGQAAMGLLATGLAWAVSGQSSVAWSAAYGALAVVVPSLLFARGLSRHVGSPTGAAMAAFFVWEMIKVALTVAMLFAAPRLVAQLSWLALLAGFVVTLKVYWVAVWLRPMRKKASLKV